MFRVHFFVGGWLIREWFYTERCLAEAAMTLWCKKPGQTAVLFRPLRFC